MRKKYPDFDRKNQDGYDGNDKNYYYRNVEKTKNSLPLAGMHECDVCIVGAGFTGLATAYFLRHSGLKVSLVERHNAGWGASGRNGGQLLPGWSADMDYIVQKYGTVYARCLWDFSVEGIDIVKSIICGHKIDCDYKSGACYLGYKEKHHEKLKRYAHKILEDYNYNIDFREGNDVAAMIGTDFYSSAVFMPDAGHLDPYKYILELTQILKQSGITFFENTPAEKISGEDESYIIKTPNGIIKTAHIVLCGDAYLGMLIPELRQKYILSHCNMIATNPLENQDIIIPRDLACCEYTIFMNFFRKSADGSLIFGGGDALMPGVSLRHTRKKNINFLVQQMSTIFPSLVHEKIRYKWGGSMAVTSSMLPNVGEVMPNIFYANGYSGHGFNNAHRMGKLLADSLLGKCKGYKVFEPVENKLFHGYGQWDRSFLAMGMMFERLKERFGN